MLRSFLRRRSTAALEYASSCYLPTSWTPLPLLARRTVTQDSDVYTFGLPAGQSLELPVCACLLLRAPGRGADGDDAVRPYTPISDNAVSGQFDLLVRRYAGGAASQFLHELPVGADVDFKHIAFNVKEQYPFEGRRTFTMLCAGSGITPMYQALLKLLGTPGDDRQVVLLYGNKSREDILLKEELSALVRAHPQRLKIVHCVGNAPDEPRPAGWADGDEYVAEVGWVDAAKIEKYAHAPSADTQVFVCGLPAMYEALCGPRTDKEVPADTVLARLGYDASMVVKM